jgi:hypothetical protein
VGVAGSALLLLGLVTAADAGSDAAPAPAAATVPPKVSRFFLGEGWGCAMISTHTGPSWHCWRPPRRPVAGERRGAPRAVAAVRAWNVPWMDGYRQLDNGPDRLCIPGMLSVKCWRPPESFESPAAPFQRSEDPEVAAHFLSGAQKVTWPEVYSLKQPMDGPVSGYPFILPIGDMPVDLKIGGSFFCAREIRKCRDDIVQPGPPSCGRVREGENDWTADVCRTDRPLSECPTWNKGTLWCHGSDAFGESGSQKDWGGYRDLAVGTWHTCATTAEGELLCWGRDDHGQLGFPAPQTCGGAAHPSGCASRPQKVPFDVPKPTALRAGDLFTCTPGPEGSGVLCWGANRDGFFGERAACDHALKASWPTLSGTARAAAPSCASRPVPIPRLAGLAIDRVAEPSFYEAYDERDYSAGPRGACVVSGGGVRCAGAVPTPAAAGRTFSRVRVSPGQDASACAIEEGGALACWGEGYAPHGDPAEVVAVALEAPPPNADDAAVDRVSTGPRCAIHRPCFAKRKLPSCAPEVTAAASPWSSLITRAPSLVGKRVSVKGPLELTGASTTAVGCLRPGDCCNGVGAGLGIGGAPSRLFLDGLGCPGDESRSCCDIGLRGAIVATGILEREDPNHRWRWEWKLVKHELCRIEP